METEVLVEWWNHTSMDPHLSRHASGLKTTDCACTPDIYLPALRVRHNHSSCLYGVYSNRCCCHDFKQLGNKVNNKGECECCI